MHGRVKKDVVEPSPEEKEKQREQVRTARALFGKMLEHRKACAYSQQTFDMTSKALQFHPEFPTLWGYRREILQSGKLEGGDTKTMLQGEMKLLEKALRKTQKVYSIWFHRKWVVERLFEVCGAQVDEAKQVLDTELDLCGRLLEVDERNFHCWNHRAHVMGLMRRAAALREETRAKEDPTLPDAEALAPPESAAAAAAPAPGAAFNPPERGADASAAAGAKEETRPDAGAGDSAAGEGGAANADGAQPAEAAKAEAPPKDDTPPDLVAIDLKLSKELINRNFSNYSAWHLRALLQQQAPAPKASGGGECQGQGAAALGGGAASTDPVDIEAELEWVQQGIYTEPNDQSVWLYHHWLTSLGRGSEKVRITHSALLGGELFVFFSQPVCARGQATARCGASADIVGELAALGPDFASVTGGGEQCRRTRRLPGARRRWLHGWRFRPDGGGSLPAALVAAAAAGGEVAVEAVVEELGSHLDGTPAHGERKVAFSGLAAPCDGSAGESSAPSPALAALLPSHSEAAPDSSASSSRGAAGRAALIKGELERVEELLEIEPNCRWALLARGRLATAAAVGAKPEEFEAVQRSVAEGYLRIAELDPLRKGFYTEAGAGCELRIRALKWLGQVRGCSGLDEPLDLTGLSLRHLPPAVMMPLFGLRRLDVSRAGLTGFGAILQLSSLEELIAAENDLVGDLREAFCLPRLRRLDVHGNTLGLREGAGGPAPPQLAEIDGSGNAPLLELLRSGPPAVLGRLAVGVSGGEWTLDGDASEGRCVLRFKAA